uniref:RING-type domain-containing protein n=1 Tax=viral metagenome TaxID=1070528 RepID=A0A6C0C4N5_9ZZZZ
MAANILGVDIHEDNKCIICLENLTSEIQYSLPECGHLFHQNCIMHWFRSGNCKCPLCNNLGINESAALNDSDTNRTWGWWRGGQHRYKMIRQYGRKKEAPQKLKNEVEKLKKMEDNQIALRNEIKEFKNKTGKWKDLNKEWNKLRGNRWKLNNRIRKKKMSISTFNIVPIIIARKVTVNI